MDKLYTLLYEDDALLVVNKAPHVLTLPDRFRPDAVPNVYKALTDIHGKIFIVHRIDKETSGTLCFAKTEAAHRDLSIQFEKRQAKKIYWALVQGTLNEKEGTINAPIAAHPAQDGAMIVHHSGKEAITDYRVVEEFKGFSWVEVLLHTGRTHQIRVHFKHIGHPLAVDTLYNQQGKSLYLSQIKQRNFRLGKWVEAEQPLLVRVPLHASKLTVNHPDSQTPITFESPLPKDLKAVLNQLNKWGR